MKNNLLKLIPSLPIAMTMVAMPVALSSCHKTTVPIVINTNYPKAMRSYIVDGINTTQTSAYFILNKPLVDNTLSVSCEITSGNFKVVDPSTDILIQCVNTSVKVTIKMQTTQSSFVIGDKCEYSLIFNSSKGDIHNYKFNGFTVEMFESAPKITTDITNVCGKGTDWSRDIEISNMFTLDKYFLGDIRIANGFEAQEEESTYNNLDTLTIADNTVLTCNATDFKITFYGSTAQTPLSWSDKTYHVSAGTYLLACNFHPATADINDFEYNESISNFDFDIKVTF